MIVQAKPGQRFWLFFLLGLLTTGGLIAIIVVVVIHILGLNDSSRTSIKVLTPVGSDFFSVRFETSIGSAGAYFIPVDIGTGSKTTVDTLLDTGSSDTWFDSSLGFQTASTSYEHIPNQSYSITYMGGSVSGVLGEDALTANTFQWHQVFAVVDSSTNNIGVPGIMGLSRGGCDARGLCVLSNWPLKYSAIGFYYDPQTWAGLFMAGFVDPETYCEAGTALTYIPQTSNYYWAGMVGMSFNGKSIGSNLNAIFDTGTTYFMMSQSLYNQVDSMLNTSGGCSSPTITLTISGTQFTIPTSVLVINNSSGRCNLRIDKFEGQINSDLLVGAAFLVNFYTVFDLIGDRIGFCPAKQGLTQTRRRLEDNHDVISTLLDDPRRRHRKIIR